MAYQGKGIGFVLFPNKNKTSDKHPNSTGKITVYDETEVKTKDGKVVTLPKGMELEIACWVRNEHKKMVDSKFFISGSAQTPWEQRKDSSSSYTKREEEVEVNW